MGGSGSGGWTPTVPSNPCERLKFRANVNSPQPTMIAALRLADVLSVSLQTTPSTAVIVSVRGTPVGALTGAKVAELVNCLQNGFQYVATVVSLQGGNCTVEVAHA